MDGTIETMLAYGLVWCAAFNGWLFDCVYGTCHYRDFGILLPLEKHEMVSGFINCNKISLRGAFLKTFPKPLTMEEEKVYLERYRNGDLEAKNVLIERNLRLVAHVARKYQSSDEDTDDLISIGTIGLIKAVQTFDYTKNSKLGTYAAKCIENAILSQMRLWRLCWCRHHMGLMQKEVASDR